MNQNVGSLDRAVRIVVAALIGFTYLIELISGTAAIVLGTLAMVFLLTGSVRTCPIYLSFGMSTRFGYTASFIRNQRR